MPLRSRFPALMAGLGVLAFALAAHAQRVALLRPPEADALLLEAFNRLNAELRLQDFEVAVIDPDVEQRPVLGLEEAAQRTQALASVALVRRGERASVDVWLGDRAAGKTSLHTIEPTPGQDAPNVLAIRAVDLLRTSLREFGGERPPPPVVRVDIKPPPPPPPAPPPRRPSWQIRAEGIVLWNQPTLGLAYGAALGLARRLSDRVEAGIFLAGPMVGSWNLPQGSTSLRQELGWAELKISGWRSGGFELGASLAAGAHHLQAQTDPNPPLLSRGPRQIWSFASALGLHGDVHLAGNAALGLTLRGIALAPKPGLEVGGDVGVVQFPMLSASVGLLVGF